MLKPEDMLLQGKTALVTGAARGLGARIAERFSEEGADVIINDLSLAAAEATAKRLGGRAVAADVSDSASVAEMFESITQMTDRIDILVNNAGISGLEGDNDAQERIRLRAEALELGGNGVVAFAVHGVDVLVSGGFQIGHGFQCKHHALGALRGGRSVAVSGTDFFNLFCIRRQQ